MGETTTTTDIKQTTQNHNSRQQDMDEGDENDQDYDNWDKPDEFQLNLPKIKTHVNNPDLSLNLNYDLSLMVNVDEEEEDEEEFELEEEEEDNAVMKSVSRWTCCAPHGMIFQRRVKHRTTTPVPIQHQKRRSLVPEIIGVQDITSHEGPETEIRLQQENLTAYENVCSEVASGVFIAGGSTAQTRLNLQRHQITHIINCVGYLYPEKFKPDVEYLTLFLMDSDHEDITCILYMCFDFIQQAKKQNGNVLIHCQKGVSRSVAITIGYLMWLNNESFEIVLEKVRSIRSIASPNIGFICALMKWERRKNGQLPPQIYIYRIAPHVKEDPLRLVPKSSPNFMHAFDPRFVYLICYNHIIYIWEGSQTDNLFIQSGQVAAQQILKYENQFNSMVNIQCGSEPQSLLLKLREFDLGVGQGGDLIVEQVEMHDQELEWFKNAQSSSINKLDSSGGVLDSQRLGSDETSVYYSAKSSQSNPVGGNQQKNHTSLTHTFKNFLSKLFN